MKNLQMDNVYFNNQLMKEIGERLRKERESRNLSIKNLLDQLSGANNCGVSFYISDSQYRRYEQEHRVSVQILAALSQLYGISLDYLIFGTTEEGHYKQFSKADAEIISAFLTNTAMDIRRIADLEE